MIINTFFVEVLVGVQLEYSWVGWRRRRGGARGRPAFSRRDRNDWLKGRQLLGLDPDRLDLKLGHSVASA